MWLSKIFAREFGFSDVQSNYSRVYAWMANQLGHMTLGMATAFIFIWIAETIYTLANDIVRNGGGFSGWWNAFCEQCADKADGCDAQVGWVIAATLIAAACVWAGRKTRDRKFDAFAVIILMGVSVAVGSSDCDGCWNFMLLTLALLFIIGCLLLVLCVFSISAPVRDRKTADWKKALERHVWAERALVLGETGSRRMIAVTAAAAGGLMVLYIPGEALTGEPGPRDEVMIFGAAAATGLFGVGCAVLCKDIRFIPIAILSLLTVFMTATAGLPFGGVEEGEPGWIAAIVIGVSMVAYTAIAMFVTRRPPEAFTKIERWVQLISNIIIGAVYFYAITGLESPEWRLVIAAAIASLSLWWIKEFASDLPNVHAEIGAVALRRPNDVLGRCGGLEKEYFRDARIDARTDGLFYFAGAWIGAGVLSNTPVMTADSWKSGSEILGLIIFLLIFLILGKNWAYRQLALDLMGAYKASRFAVFRSRLWLTAWTAAPGAAAKPVSGVLENPLLKLWDLAISPNIEGVDFDEEDRDLSPVGRFDHVLVFGEVGSGRSPLGRAIASEASLADWPTRFQVRRRAKVEPGDERTARYIRADRLRTYWLDIRTENDLGANPTVPHFVHKTRKLVRRKLGPNAKRDDWRLGRAADLVVIDDVGRADLSDAGWLKASGDWLNLENAQQTVWLIDHPLPHEAPGDDDFEKAVEAASGLIAMLAERTNADDGRDTLRIGVAFTRRHESDDEDDSEE